MISAELLKVALPQCAKPDLWADALNSVLGRYGIDTPARIASFLAQTGHESGQFNRLTENLNYSVAGLMKTWPKRFPTVQIAEGYARNPEKLANFVYANRLGNGDVPSGDGFRFRGRGLIQITGKSNYLATGKALGLDLVGSPDLLLQAEHAAASAAWFWSNHGLNALADDNTDDQDLEDFTEITRRINGGTIGLKERFALYKTIESRLA
ncbi:MAG TPA: glycoside hydrolase family 19 protein [Paucimonas sp.]|nr:glycoside hydrolase family 19 protein [Paucimonas sp.]